MAIRHLLNLTRRSHKHSSFTQQPTRSASSSPAIATHPLKPSPPPSNLIIYDRLANTIKSKLRRLENPDPRFLRYASPHPIISDHANILSSPETRITTLPNSLRITTESDLAARTATVGVWIDAGSRLETEDTNGLAHFFEHMVFKGKRKRPVKVLEDKIENIGGHLNAYTSREQTAYYAKVTDKFVPKALEILAGILQNSQFEENWISRERNVILREMAEVERHSEEVVFDHLHATAFQYSPLGRTILGPAKNIQAITKDDIQNYISTHYAAHRLVICAAGAIKHDDIIEQVNKLFTKLSANPTTTSQLVANEPAIFTGSEIRIIDDDLPLAQFAVASNGASWTDPDSIALMVMQFMLGSWNKNARGGKHMGSELSQRVGINEIVESMVAFNTNYKDTGLFGVYAVAKPNCLDDLAYAIMYEISKLFYRVSEADVTCDCNQLKSSLLLYIDGTIRVAEDIGRQLLTYGQRISFAELFARIDAVDACTIKRVANRFIFDRFVLKDICPQKPDERATEQEAKPYQKWVKVDEMARCFILSSMSNVLQHQHQSMPTTYVIMFNLKEIFGNQTRAARQTAMKHLLTTTMAEGTPVRDHVLKMIGLLNELKILGSDIDGDTQVDIILQSLPDSFKQFYLNYNMNNLHYSLVQLLKELMLAEGIIKKPATALVTKKGSTSKPKGVPGNQAA